MYQYWAFGLHISSEIEFPELSPAPFYTADVNICLSQGLEQFREINRAKNNADFLTSKDKYFLEVKEVCKYYVADISTVFIEPSPAADARSVRLYLLATVMAYILHKRNKIPLHASAILKDEKLVLFTGDSGAGKSTTLAGLIKRGHTVFTDDVCVLQQNDDGKVEGIASYPMIKLWDNSIELLGNEMFTEKNFRVRHDMDKYGFFFHDAVIKSGKEIDKIFILKKSPDVHNAECVRLLGLKAFRELEKQAYRKNLIRHKDMRSAHFSIISALIEQSPVYQLSRPEDLEFGIFISELEKLI